MICQKRKLLQTKGMNLAREKRRKCRDRQNAFQEMNTDAECERKSIKKQMLKAKT
jgi:hypothetical protein